MKKSFNSIIFFLYLNNNHLAFESFAGLHRKLKDSSNDSLNFESSLKNEFIMTGKIMDPNNGLNLLSNTSQNATAYSVNDVVMNEKILLKHLSFSLYRLSQSENFIDKLKAKIKELNVKKSIGNDKTESLERDLKQSKERLNSLENDKLNVENDIKLSKRQLNEKIN